ncbi:MAG: dTDP-4-dehydrorhamnose reductase [Holophagales bacterium]|nr:dTDP-4-dehydrorhamnose reductase [Holophagales bacterium]
MRTLVAGGEGMLGRAVARQWRLQGQPVLALGRDRLDITDPESVDAWTDRFQPSVIVNCAAFTKVDECESSEELATRVNGGAVSHLAAAAERHGALLVHVSSDYVFDGRGSEPLGEDAPVGPRSAYGRSKLAGEEMALGYGRGLVVRASWLFGPGGPNFVATIRRLLLEGKTPLRVVDDQVGRPTYTPFLARALWDLARLRATGIVHYGNREAVSWHGFATAIARQVAPAASVVPVPTSEFPRPAERPAYSVLDVSKFEALAGRAVEPWLSGLSPYLELLGDSRP